MVNIEFDIYGNPSIELTQNNSIDLNKYHTIVLRNDKGDIYLLVYNIIGSNGLNGIKLVDYRDPSPGDNMFLLEVYEQFGSIAPKDTQSINDIINRSYLVDQFVYTLDSGSSVVYNPPKKESNSGSGRPRGIKKGEVPFKSGNNLSTQEKKYCSCQLKVQSQEGAVNPYAVCAKSVGTSTRDCNFDFDKMSNVYLKAYMDLHNIEYKKPFNRKAALRKIKNKLGK